MTTSRWSELFSIWTYSENILIISSSVFELFQFTRPTEWFTAQNNASFSFTGPLRISYIHIHSFGEKSDDTIPVCLDVWKQMINTFLLAARSHIQHINMFLSQTWMSMPSHTEGVFWGLQWESARPGLCGTAPSTAQDNVVKNRVFACVVQHCRHLWNCVIIWDVVVSAVSFSLLFWAQVGFCSLWGGVSFQRWSMDTCTPSGNQATASQLLLF